MSLLGIRRSLRHLRLRTAGVVVVVALGGAILAHHSALAMGDMHHGDMGSAIEFCLGVLTAVGTFVATAALALGVVVRLRAPLGPALVAPLLIASIPAPAARAGPGLVSRLCVQRR